MSTKNELLQYLKNAEGIWISGESISHRMHITRTAVWKHISALRDEGYIIESFPRKGYCLRFSPDILTEHEICSGLKTKIIGHRGIFHWDKLDSTNAKAKELAMGEVPDGALVIAEMQTEGRGRRKRDWCSAKSKGIYVSLVLRPSIPPSEASKITLLSSVAAAESLETVTGLTVTIKWPNDIMISGKKVGGILTEMGTEMDRVDYVIVGYGLNVNMASHDFPANLRERSTSLLMATGKECSRVELLQDFLKRFESYYEIFQNSGFSKVMDRWRAYENVIGRTVRVDMMTDNYQGKVVSVDDDGVLVVMDKIGRERRFISGDVTFLE